MNIRWLKLLIPVIFLGIAGFCYSYRIKTSDDILISSADSVQIEKTFSDSYADGGQTAALQTDVLASAAVAVPLCYVHICGQVQNPGVYSIRENSRIFEAIFEAGGFTESADQQFLNLAEIVTDGMQIVVYSKEETEQMRNLGTLSSDSGNPTFITGNQINLNKATKEQLMTLKGIGESRAQDILKYREEHGNFQKIEDIMNVSGIKQGAYEKIKDDICV